MDGIDAGANQGYGIPRNGWIVSITTTADVTSVSGGTMTPTLGFFGRAGSVVGPVFDSSGANQAKTVRASTRIVAEDNIACSLEVTGTITCDDVLVLVEIELKR